MHRLLIKRTNLIIMMAKIILHIGRKYLIKAGIIRATLI